MCVCVVILKESECHHSIWSPMDKAQPSPKSNRDQLVKDNLGEKGGGGGFGGCRSSVAEHGFNLQRHHLYFSPFYISKVFRQ